MIYKTIELWEKCNLKAEDGSDFKPTLRTYVLDGENKRGAGIVCPGGGYHFTSAREAEQIAIKFNSAGFHAFILYYSTAPNKHPQPILDISRAMNIIKENADTWKVDSLKIAVCGFSAGGHLAASLAVNFDKPYLKNVAGIDTSLIRPEALILAYPVITPGEFAHKGSFINLLGENPSEELLQETSLEKQVSSETPPSFIWHTFQDKAVPVENSLFFANALRKNNVPFELHIYPEGGHGLSLATKETGTVIPHVATWMNLCIEWLDNQFCKE